MNNYTKSTIVALSSAAGYAGIAVVRISGNLAYNVANIIRLKHQSPEPIKPLTHKVSTYCDFFDKDGNILDSGILVYYKAPHSFTGEDVVEIQGHGSPVVVNLILQRCLELGCKMAEPGEFSQRAYLNNKIDLAQAEGIIDLIYAQSELAAKGALQSLKGAFSNDINAVIDKLIYLRMFVEATLDFPDEDIDFIHNEKVYTQLSDIKKSLELVLNNSKQGVILNNGINIVIIGKPNVGKSSLLNALSQAEIAIVTDIPGTTRDTITQKILINGIACNIIDTAGIRNTTDTIEKIGIQKTLDSIKNADICLVLIDSTKAIAHEDIDILASIPPTIPKIVVFTKADLLTSMTTELGTNHLFNELSHIQILISSKTGYGIDTLKQKILSTIGFNDINNNHVYIARTRHVNAIDMSIMHIDNALKQSHALELVAEEIRFAHDALGVITGAISSDELLGMIFKKFCIGK